MSSDVVSSEDDDIPQTVFNIYAGRSIADLDERSNNFPSARIRKLPILKKCKCSGKLLDEAVVSYELGDLEMAYIKYMRYFMLLDIIHKSADYIKHKSAVTQMLGSHEYKSETIKRLEVLTNSLTAKYEELAAEEKRLNKTIELDNPHKQRPDNFFTPKAGRASSPKRVITPVTQKKKTPKCRTPALTHVDTPKKREYVTCQELYKMITAKRAVPTEVLLDCRPYNDYFESKIVHQCCLNVDEEIIQRGLTISIVASYYKPESIAEAIWKSRSAAENVILYDWHTNEEKPINDTPLEILKSLLHTWDTTANYKSLKFLKGGFAEFLKLYPNLTSDPDVVPPPCKVKSPVKPTVEEAVEYSSVEEITMKEETFSVGLKNISVISEDASPESLKKFNVKSLKEKVVASEKLADKSVSLGQELLSAEKELKCAIMATESAADEDTKQKENQKVIELEYDVLQLENSSHDTTEEFHILFDEVNVEKEFLPDAIPTCVLKEIEKKDNELQKLIEMSEQVAQEKRLSETREAIPPSPIKVPVAQVDKTVSKLTEVVRELLPTKPKPTEIVPRGLTGLVNLGNTCYMDSILQCLSNTMSLTEYFINRVYARHIEPGQSSIVDNLGVVIRSLWSGKFESITPHAFFAALGERYQPFSENEQEDSQELLMLLLDWLHNDLAQPPFKPVFPPNANLAEKNWLEFVARQPSDMLGMFFGQLKNTIKCEKCNLESGRYETFSMLNLTVPSGNDRFELSQCLDLFFNGEIIEYKCEQCCERGEASGFAVQKLNITRLPPYLILHLKRFNNDLTKKRNFINFPLVNLKMDAYIAPSEADSGKKTVSGSYSLYSVSNHFGNLGTGHYTACCKNSITGRWYKFDDRRVVPKVNEELETSAAYILFYTKINIIPPPEVTLID